MWRWRIGAAFGLAAMAAACGGGGGSSPTPPPTAGTPTPTPTPTPTTAGCSLTARQNWAAAQLNEWYLFPETLPTSLSPAGYSTVEAYIDALTATARAQGRDRFFTHLTSIKEENAFFQSGSNAGFGFRLGLDPTGTRLFSIESFEQAPALQAGIDRGTEILAIGTSAANLRNVSDILASEGSNGVFDALGPSDPGVTRVFRISDAQGTRTVTVTKTEYELLPVSPRYGVKILDDNGRKVGYLNLRTFIDTADPALRDAFANFRAQGVTDVIIDLRYNGGGLVRIAELFGDLLGRNRTTSDVQSFTTFRPSKSQFDETRFFSPQPQSIAPTRIAFIGTGGTASASELVINAMIPYLNNGMALVGTNTFGKPVGQIALDKAECDDRLRVVAFKTENKLRQGDYYNGLAATVPNTCRADDDIARPLGDPLEASTARALDFLAGRQCTPITSATTQGFRETTAKRVLLTPEQPTAAQREVPGLF